MKIKKRRASGQKIGAGRLRIGDDWNAISIIALSQTNPLKAIAEFVENSIDARAGQVTIIRGKERGHAYLKVIDDGQGLPCTEAGIPDFKYVATHICDSLKKRLKQEGVQNIQGEFGIGLLSFWTVGHKLSLISSGKDGKSYQMTMEKGKPGYAISCRPHLLPVPGAQLTVIPLLSGIRALNGEKIQRYLACELRDRIRRSGVQIKIIDRTGRCEYKVEPRQYEGRLMHDLPILSTAFGDIYAELYLSEKSPENRISLFRSGTRVLPDINVLDNFQAEPWNLGYFQGIIDAPFLHLTPGTRDGIIFDERFQAFSSGLETLKERLAVIAAEQAAAEEERMSKNILRSVQKALKDAMLVLPPEEYDWFDVRQKDKLSLSPGKGGSAGRAGDNAMMIDGAQTPADAGEKPVQKEFFEIAGPLLSARIQPGSAIVPAGKTKSLRAVGLDRRRRAVEQNLSYEWTICAGKGELDKDNAEIVIFTAPAEPGLSTVKAVVKQDDVVCAAECVITVVDSLMEMPPVPGAVNRKGLPAYTLENAPGQMWRSRYDEKRNLIIVNSGHRDFIFAGKERARKLRYICRLFAKELILHNVAGENAELLMERLIQLSLYTEEHLK